MPVMPKRGLYAITPDGKTAEEILEFTQAVLKGGACVVQYRAKAPPPLPPSKGGEEFCDVAKLSENEIAPPFGGGLGGRSYTQR